jgi:hypothetical protein
MPKVSSRSGAFAVAFVFMSLVTRHLSPFRNAEDLQNPFQFLLAEE